MTAPHITLAMLAKAPKPGHVKTRLTPWLSLLQASKLHEAFLLDLAKRMHALNEPNLSLVLSHAGDASHPAFLRIQRDFGFTPLAQREGDLGQKMGLLATELFRAPETNGVIFIGSDSPSMPTRIVRQAIEDLKTHDVVLGPSFDGGYYLIGMKKLHLEVFQNIDWSTSSVMAQTQRRCLEAGLKTSWLEFWYDVDLPQDVLRLRSHLLDYLAPEGIDEYSETLKVLLELELQPINPLFLDSL